MNYAENKKNFQSRPELLNLPMKSVFLTAEWRNLVMINYEVEPSILKTYLPAGTEPDQWERKSLISLVGFQFLNTRVKGLRIPFHENFEEVNLRFYVKRRVAHEWRRGVVFISELVPKPAIAFVPNTLFHEKYKTVKMKSRVHGRTGLQVHYEWKWKGRWNKIFFHTLSETMPVTSGSIEEFITEHYWGYNKVNEMKTTEYGVRHPRWTVYPCSDYALDCDFGTLYGNEFAVLNRSTPHSVFMAEGSAIEVTAGHTF